MLKAGVRVVRGPNWKWGGQDRGPGHLGTVVKVADDKESACVSWDSGDDLLHALLTLSTIQRYRTGENTAYDLRVFCTAEADVIHNGIWCDNCKQPAIKGIRWKCTECNQYDLCTPCYMSDLHNECHIFLRIDRPGHKGVKCSPRCDTDRYKAFDLRISDWCGKRPSGTLGYYKDHLPILGLFASDEKVRNHRLAIGDKVVVSCSESQYRAYQTGHGGINQEMISQRGEEGKVIHIHESGNVRVQYDDCSSSFVINPDALNKKGGCTCASGASGSLDLDDLTETMGKLLLVGALMKHMNK